MLIEEQKKSILDYLERTREAILADIGGKRQNFSGPLRVETTDNGGVMIGPDYFKYLITGRGPGKQPPIEPLEAWAKKYASRDKKGRYVSSLSLAWAVAKKIAREGTDIYTGKKKGIDFIGSMEKNMPALLSAIARIESLKITTNLLREIRAK